MIVACLAPCRAVQAAARPTGHAQGRGPAEEERHGGGAANVKLQVRTPSTLPATPRQAAWQQGRSATPTIIVKRAITSPPWPPSWRRRELALRAMLCNKQDHLHLRLHV